LTAARKPASLGKVIELKKLLWIVPVVLAVAACSTVKKVVVKDIPLEDQEAITKEQGPFRLDPRRPRGHG